MYNGVSYSPQFYSNETLGFQQSQQPRYQQNAVHGYPTPPGSPQSQYLPSPTYQRPPTHLERYVPNFVEEKVLGTGAYGTVYLVRDLITGAEYACKALNKLVDGRPVDTRTQQFQQTEMDLHYRASAHPNIVSLLKVVDTPIVTYVFLEYCPEGDLFANITEYQRYQDSPNEAKFIFLQIVKAVAHCHNLGIYHRDLKPENILVSQNGTQAKLADFGLATTERFSKDFGCGSTFYMSPECHDMSTCPSYSSEANDIWSLGVILVNLTCGRNPWKVADAKKDSTYKAFRTKPDFLKEILPISDDLNDILKRTFTRDPAQRITLQELYNRVYNCMSFSNVPTPVINDLPQQYYNVPSYQTPFVTYDPGYPVDSSYDNRSNGSYSSAHSSFSDISTAPFQSSVESAQNQAILGGAVLCATNEELALQLYMLQPSTQPSFTSTFASGIESLFNYTNKVSIQHLLPPFLKTM